MPEGYTHVRTALKAAVGSRYKVECPAAFAAGANGPDIFYAFEAWKRPSHRRCDLPALGRRMHEENTGAFLQNLLAHVVTRPQVEYALGFLTHYALDTVMHPFVQALCQPGMPYAKKGGHAYFEIGLDSTLHAEDTGVSQVSAQTSSPVPTGAELAEISALLHTAILETYGEDVPVECIADSFYYTHRLRRLLTSHFGFRKALCWLIEPFFGGRGALTGHISPRHLALDLPDSWQNPYTGETVQGGAFALLRQGEKRAALYMTGALQNWLGVLPAADFARVLGSMSYSEGRPTERSDPSFVPNKIDE